MIEFKSPELSDRKTVTALLAPAKARGCDYNFGTLFIWKDYFNIKYADVCGSFAAEMTLDGRKVYICPMTPVYEDAVKALYAHCKEQGHNLTLACVTVEELAALSGFMPGGFTSVPDRDGYDYIYNINDLADLSGRKYHGKKNHVNRFKADNPEWSFEELTPAAASECLAMDDLWMKERLSEEGEKDSFDAMAEAERKCLELCFAHWDELKLTGGVLRTKDGIAAFTIGEIMPCGDTVDTHFEKALSSVQGAYAAINKEFASFLRNRYPNLRYINREEDLGLPGLRTAKESYHPEILLEENIVIFN